MLAAMALPLGPLGYHFTLAPAVGILLGGGMAFVAAAVVNTILALLGHGGFTTVGLNAIIMGSAAASASFAFLHMRPRWGAFRAGVSSTLIAHAVALVLYLMIVGLAGFAPNPGETAVVHQGHTHGIIQFGSWEVAGERLLRFALLALPFWLLGGAAEAFVTGGAMNFLDRVSPFLLPGPGAR